MGREVTQPPSGPPSGLVFFAGSLASQARHDFVAHWYLFALRIVVPG
jgi:hypothetical protein